MYSCRRPLVNWICQTIYHYAKKIYYTLIQKRSDILKFPHLEQNFRKIVTQDLSEEVKHIYLNTLILWGEQDSYTPIIWAYELEKKIQHSRLYVFPQAGHNLPIRYPKHVWEKTMSFLKYAM